MPTSKLNLAPRPPQRSHPPIEPQPHLNPPEQGIRFRTVVEWIMLGVLAVLLVALAIFGLLT